MHKKELCRCQQQGIKNRRIGFIERPKHGVLKFDVDCPLHGSTVLKRDGVFDDSILRSRLDQIEGMSPESSEESWEDSFIDGLEDFYDFVSNSILADSDDLLRKALDDAYHTPVPPEDDAYLSGWHCARDVCANKMHEALDAL